MGGALFGYFIVFPFGFKFFVDYASDYITVMPTISAYFSLAVTLLFAFGLIFELPVFIFFLTSLGMVSTKTLRKFRRWAILLSFIVAAVLTPTPDAINQLLMAGPMVVLYEVGIWVSWFVDKQRLEEKARRKAEQEAAADGGPKEPPRSPDTPGAPEAPEAPETTATAAAPNEAAQPTAAAQTGGEAIPQPAASEHTGADEAAKTGHAEAATASPAAGEAKHTAAQGDETESAPPAKGDGQGPKAG